MAATSPTTDAAVAPAPIPARPKPPLSGDALGDEVGLIASIRSAAKAGDPRRVIALAEDHAETFPHGRLVAERRAYEAAARCSVGQLRRGRALAERYLEKQPYAVLATSVRNACFGG